MSTTAARSTVVDDRKTDGIHYTPSELASFVAGQIVATIQTSKDQALKILDPAAGDGQLLVALAQQLTAAGFRKFDLDAFDTNATALGISRTRLTKLMGEDRLQFHHGDFLEFAMRNFDGERRESDPHYDIVIANPPYVRTQVLGAQVAQRLAQRFELNGRVELYHAFLAGLANVMNPGGIVGVIVSNRFMTTKTGAGIRAEIRKQFDIQHVWDLGDTKIFDAAVLPAVLLMNRKQVKQSDVRNTFTSIYSCRDSGPALSLPTVYEALNEEGLVELSDRRRFCVIQGKLADGKSAQEIWRVSGEKSDDWLATVAKHTWATFSDIGKIRVGVKTTADKIFIHSDWDAACPAGRPELLRPLITHKLASRFRGREDGVGTKQILYPHAVQDGKRCAVDLNKFPISRAYLEKHKTALSNRKYVKKAGRQWYEIWVPHDPDGWTNPKLVWRDICEQPVFWIDRSGSIVNGDCYWMTCSKLEDESLLWLALAVGNSSFVEQFYDYRFGNKLYAGRRRFITQYVNSFPLPDPSTDIAKQILDLTRQLFMAVEIDKLALERQLNQLVWQSFGFVVKTDDN